MTPKKKTEESGILGRAMLVNVNIGVWSARKHDAKVTGKANDRWAKTQQAGRYHKKLFAGNAPSHSHLMHLAQVGRVTHYKHTLPWEDQGWRLLPTENYFQYVEALRKVKEEFEAALERFLRDYPGYVRQAEELLGTMYNRRDYPRTNSIRRKFHFDIEFGPVPSANDFRVQLPQKELQRMAKSVEARITTAVQEAMGDVWQRLGDAVTTLREKLDDGKFLRATMIERVGEVAEILGRLNLTSDAKLEKARKDVLRDLAGLDVQVLRDDDKVRDDAAKKADAILKQMKGLYQPTAA